MKKEEIVWATPYMENNMAVTQEDEMKSKDEGEKKLANVKKKHKAKYADKGKGGGAKEGEERGMYEGGGGRGVWRDGMGNRRTRPRYYSFTHASQVGHY